VSADLRVPLASLPGFDACGLDLHGDGMVVHVMDHDFGADMLVYNERWKDVPFLLHVDFALTEWALDLSDAATRDRVARWVAGRVGLGVGATAPTWFASGHGVFRVFGADRGRVLSFAPTRTRESPARVSGLDHYLPSMSDLDWRSTGRLADDCLIVEAEALALVAVHLGSTP
jgi:hypothetical protein